jgi:DNA-binding GntR family transcriptional regulator
MGVVSDLAPDSLRGQIASQIRERIVSGTLAAGERLVEKKPATDRGTSITAVREAMIALETNAAGAIVSEGSEIYPWFITRCWTSGIEDT